MKILRIASRIIVGLVFVFSGFVKGVDPLGTAYKLSDYFFAFGMEFMDPFVLPLSIVLIATEFVIGFALLLGVRMRLASWGVMVFMVFFTILTLYLAIKNPVHDCGCFGDAIILSNWGTFYKNLVIMAFTVIIFINRKCYKPAFCAKAEWGVVGLGVIIIVGISWYCLSHLPIIDFRPWKIGSSMIEENAAPPKSFVTYKNKNTGETKEYLSTNYPWDDSVWMSNWEFVSSRVEQVDHPSNELKIEDAEGNDVTNDLIRNPSYQFLLVMYFVKDAAEEPFDKINRFYEKCQEENISFVGLTGSAPQATEKYMEKMDAEFPMYHADEIALKTVVRANPGLVLLKNGTILGKWHYNDMPAFKTFKEEYLENGE